MVPHLVVIRTTLAMRPVMLPVQPNLHLTLALYTLNTADMMGTGVGNLFACHRGHLDPSGPKSKKNRKMSPQRHSDSGPPRVQNGVENESKSTSFQQFWLVLDSVLDFLDTASCRKDPVACRETGTN